MSTFDEVLRERDEAWSLVAGLEDLNKKMMFAIEDGVNTSDFFQIRETYCDLKESIGLASEEYPIFAEVREHGS